jgi:hypothetical protein
LPVHKEIAPYFEKSTEDFRGQPEAALAWVRKTPGSFAAGAIPHGSSRMESDSSTANAASQGLVLRTLMRGAKERLT